MPEHRWLKPGDVRRDGDIVRVRGKLTVEDWSWCQHLGDIITPSEFQTYEYFRPCPEWIVLWGDKIRK